MGCNCNDIKDLPTCLNELVLGTIELLNQDVYVFIKNNSNGQFTRLTAQSDIDGLVTLDLTQLPDNYFSDNYNYDFWVTLTSGTPSGMQTIVIEGADYDCLNANFFRVVNESIESVYYSSIIAEIA
jgi:hypothetical protein